MKRCSIRHHKSTNGEWNEKADKGEGTQLAFSNSGTASKYVRRCRRMNCSVPALNSDDLSFRRKLVFVRRHSAPSVPRSGDRAQGMPRVEQYESTLCH
jgi:hypothetical protein